MPTFLTTPKMPPELAARIEARVTGRKKGPAATTFAPRIPISVLLPAVAILLVVGIAVMSNWSTRRETARTRSELMTSIQQARASLAPEASYFLPVVESWVVRLAGPYEGDLVSDQVRLSGGLRAQLKRPVVYVRGPLTDLARSDQIPMAANASMKDSLLLCLLDPPSSTTEDEVLAKVRGANFTLLAPNIRRLHEAEAGLGVLRPSWEDRVGAAPDRKALASLQRDFTRAPIEDGKLAASAEVLVVAIDEPPEGEVRGAAADHPHAVRLGIVDLRSDTVLVRLRRPTNPSAVGAEARTAFGRAVAGCQTGVQLQDAAKE
ncbi:MAG: hypothetical protein CVU63_06530 [Deltaproteobacteria bacterium HGW-Deltaproteobacteria-20]|nr:MAG: hypothetical protein CVU63_06530 [Deltaproteobacteria bacterium HGW-Deltaproteobacteria-20]